MEFKNTRVYNFEGALRGMRNPKKSWAKSDSFFGLINPDIDIEDGKIVETWMKFSYPEEDIQSSPITQKYAKKLLKEGILASNNGAVEIAFIGPKDMQLAQTLIKAGPEHRKFLRQIFVSVDITAPLYWY